MSIKKALACWIASAASLLPAGVALAAEAVPGTGAPDLTVAAVKMVAVLVGLIAVLLLAMRLMRRLGSAGNGLFGGREIIRIIATRPLAPKKYIALVEVGGAVLTLGVTGDRITCLDKSSASDFREFIGQGPREEPAAGFSDRLR
ncbi:MAG: flagellar biosynthetic protein FliO, partial [Proteobacteria bacterium]|nr:flagellar biosynthetic protein FliO [Pseudomonadota bacterium]